MPRPQGDVRQALADAALRLMRERGLVVSDIAVDGVTWRDIACEAMVGFGEARRTVDNMVRAGELVRLGSRKLAGGKHWHALYAPARLVAAAQAPAVHVCRWPDCACSTQVCAGAAMQVNSPA